MAALEVSTLTSTDTATITATITATLTSSPTVTVPHTAHIVINEVAWMGNPGTGNSVDEWIELFNPPNAPPVNFASGLGWELRTKDGSLRIPLQGSVAPGGFYLIVRSRTVGDTSGILNNIADQYYTGLQLSDYGAALQLVNLQDSLVVDTANDSGGSWPAGNATTRCTMERISADSPDIRSSWFTNSGQIINGLARDGRQICGTPRQPNWAYFVTATFTSTVTPTRTITPMPTNVPFKPVRTATSTPNRTLPSSIVINEFLTQPHFDWNGDGKVDDGDEFIELVNLSSLPVSIAGWRLDDREGDSNPYTIGNITMQPNTHLVFFQSQTGILLSNGGDSVRLFKSTGQISDAFTYGVVETPDQSWCRLPDGNGIWVFGCAPTPGSANRLAESVFVGNHVESALCLSKKLPPGLVLAECDPLGLFAWDSFLWDGPSPDFPRFFDVDDATYILQ
jgi:hypothetical protein